MFLRCCINYLISFLVFSGISCIPCVSVLLKYSQQFLLTFQKWFACNISKPNCSTTTWNFLHECSHASASKVFRMKLKDSYVPFYFSKWSLSIMIYWSTALYSCVSVLFDEDSIVLGVPESKSYPHFGLN